MTSVAICIPTYKRPEFLGKLLRSLTALCTEEMSLRVVVVDNDFRGSAEAVTKPFTACFPELVYEIEPERGISAARNRLVAIATRVRAHYLAFVDDDERVDPAWLSNLICTAVEHDADAVGGPVLPEYDDDVPRWIRAGRFFDRPRHRTGERLMLIRTGNLLVKRAWLERLDGPFDRRFDLTGGGDTHLLQRLFQLGARMVWCDEALVYERVPASRATVRCFLERRFRIGVGHYRRIWQGDPTPMRCAVQTARAATRIGYGVVMLLPSLLRGRGAVVHALGHCAMGTGGLLGMVGFSYQAYRQVHGR